MTSRVRILLSLLPILLVAAAPEPEKTNSDMPKTEKPPLLSKPPRLPDSPTEPVLSEVGPRLDPAGAAPSGTILDDLFGKYLPRLGYSYDGFDSVGREGGLSSFQMFVPLYQDRAASRLLFSDSRVLLFDSRGSLGANLGLGGRLFSDTLGRTVGGYLYWDYSDTGRASFNQVSGGVETLGDLLDARANFYVPLNKERKQVDQFFTSNEPTFQGNYLLVGGGQGIRFMEQALYGFDGEAGLKVMAQEGIELRAFAGMYHYQGEAAQQAWGPRGRLEARVRDTLAMGVSVQNDRLFGTTVNLNVLMTFPRLSGRAYSDGPAAPLPAQERLGDPVVRTQQVAVLRQQERFSVAGQPLIDPATNQPYLFLHVAPGGNSDGSFENPYASLASAFADSRFSAGNVIVYDRTRGTFGGDVTLAPGTRLLSSAPTQYVDSSSGRVLLPFSGAGTDLTHLPSLRGTVTVTGSNTIAGYHLIGVGPGAVVAAEGGSPRDIVLRNNRFTGQGTAVWLPGTAGTIDIRDNTFYTPGGGAIWLGVRGMDSANITLFNNQITRSSGDAIAISALDQSRLVTQIEGNRVQNAAGAGVMLTTGAAPGSSTIDARVRNNFVQNSSSVGEGAISLMTTGGGAGSRITARVGENVLRENLAPGVTARSSGPNVLALDLFENQSISRHSMVGFLLQQQAKGKFQMVHPDTVGSRNNGAVMTTGTIDAIPRLP